MKIFLFSVNHKKPLWLQELQQDYVRRLPQYVHFVMQHTAPSNKKKEAEELLKLSHKLSSASAIKVALCIQGKMMSSESFADKIEFWQQSGKDLIFYIGGADGLDDSLIQQCQLKWSFSELTFSHFIAQLIFSEQLYRAFSIIQRHPYHISHA